MKAKKLVSLLLSVMLLSVVALCGCEPTVKKYEYPIDPSDIVFKNEFIKLSYWFFTSTVQNNRILFYEQEKDISFDMTVSEGSFDIYSDEPIRQLIAYPGEEKYWFEGDSNRTQDFIRIVVKQGDKIAGFTLIEMLGDSHFMGSVAHIAAWDKFTKKEMESMTLEKVNKIMDDVTKQAEDLYEIMDPLATEERFLYMIYRFK